MKKALIGLLITSLLLSILGFIAYQKVFGPQVSLNEEKKLFYVNSATSFDGLTKKLHEEGIVKDTSSYKFVAQLMKFDLPKAGRYEILNKASNRELISILRSGSQQPINLTFNNQRTIYDLIGLFSQQLEADSIDLVDCMLDEAQLKRLGYEDESLLTMFIPNSYQVYWDCNCTCLLDRFEKEHHKFFTTERLEKLSVLGLTEKELYILASIVQKETLVAEEKSTVAGVYLNRLNRGQLLQADPTVVFASGQFDLRRVLNKHLAIDSPYNTYKYEGLPPGPICMPDVQTIDAVLNYEKHNYLYFCASPDNSGRHVFAKSLIQHNINAKHYRKFLNSQRIYK